MRGTTVQDPPLPRELERRIDRCRTYGEVAEVLIEWGYEHGFVKKGQNDERVPSP